MGPMLGTAHEIEVEAPDGHAALELELRLYRLHPTAIQRHNRWVVDLDGVHRVENVEAEVKDWLRQIGTPSTTMHVDGRPVTVAGRKRARAKSTHADFIG